MRLNFVLISIKYFFKKPTLAWAFLFSTMFGFPIQAQTVVPTNPVQTNNGFYESEWKPFSNRLLDDNSLKIFVAAVLSTAATHQIDEFSRAEWKDHQHLNEKQADIGDILGTGIPAVLVLGGQYFYDRPNAKTHLRAFVWGNVFTYGLKTVANRKRPGDSRSYQSFPSGHTSTTFATATALTYSYGWKAAVITYPLAIYTGASRMADDRHWLSDVVAGAYLGFLIGRASYFAMDYSSEVAGINKSSSHWWPDFYSNGAGIQMYYSF